MGKKVIVIIRATESSLGLDTAVISYKQNLEFAPSKEVRKTFSNCMPASFEIDLQGPVGSIRIAISGESNVTMPSTYVERGDTVSVLVKGTGKEAKASYHDKASEKYMIQSKLDSISFWGIYPANHSRQEKTKPINLKSVLYRFDEVRKEKIQLLQLYKHLLTPILYNLYSTDIYGKFISNSSATAASFLKETNYEASLLPIIGQFLSVPLDTSNFTTQSLSRDYLKGLRDYTKLKVISSKHRQPQLKETYETLRSNFSGRWKEKMVSYYLQNLPKSNPSEYIDCLKDALSFVTDSTDRNSLQQLLNSRQNGKPAYDFSLEDKDGRLVRLSDLKGRVVLLDFWFTGCTFCARLSKKMGQEVLPYIKAKDNLVYVSISIDKDKAKWIKSLASGEYTHGTNINLTTGKSGNGHPIISHYKIMNYPTLILVDRNGNIVDANMNYTESKTIIDRINNAF